MLDCTMVQKDIYIDIMLNGHFERQLKYKGNYHLEEDLNGNIVKCFSEKDVKEFVERKCPRLVGKGYNVEFTKQRI